jgi:hypothetical protein
MWTLVDTLEADSRIARAEVFGEKADGLAYVRAMHGFANARINRTGCMEDWADQLRAEFSWLKAFKADLREWERRATEQAEEERREEREREAEQLRVAAEVEQERQKKKARFLGSFKGLKWL